MKKCTLLSFLLLVGTLLYAQEPDISVDADTVWEVLANGETSKQSFTIYNNGDTTLHWSIDFTNFYSNGPAVMFVKEDNTDWTLADNQDRITDNVWITRDITQSLFNARSEASSASDSPEGTLWDMGDANETIPDSNFTSFVSAHGGNPQGLVGDTITLYLEDDQIYFNVEFTSYSGGGPGGGFAYKRWQMVPWYGLSELSDSILKGEQVTIEVDFNASILESRIHRGALLISSNDPDTPLDTVVLELDILPPGKINIVETEIVDTVVAGSSTTFDITIQNSGLADLSWNVNNYTVFTKADYADWTLAENQDRITDNVWITRKEKEGIFNIAQEFDYERGNDWESPVGTQWAWGKTNDVTESDYTTWRQAVRSHIRTDALPGKTLSLKIIEEEIYFDVEWLQWTDRDAGGGFSYIRTSPSPEWITGDMTGTVPGDFDSVITFTLDASELTDGIYTYDMEFRSSDATKPLIIVPVALHVMGTPELTTDVSYNYGNVFLGVSKTYKLPIENTGTSVLNITSITTDSAEFVPLNGSLTLAPGTIKNVQVVFTPSRLGYISDTIRITSNDTVTPLTKVFIEGTGLDLPAIALSSYSFSDTVMQDTVTTDTIIMTNTGESDLVWNITSSGGITFSESGFLFSFSRGPDANVDLAENRDSINGYISLVREGGGGLEDYYGKSLEWAMGSTMEVLSSGIEYDSEWRNAMDNQASNLPGKTISMHIIDDDVYVDIHIESWGSRRAGRMYSYKRSAPMYYWLDARNIDAANGGHEGVLPPDSSQRVVIYHDATGIFENGVFEGGIVLNTNIPAKPEVVISNKLTVDGVNPMISLDTSSVSATLISEGFATKEFTIANDGTGLLFWQLGEPEDSGTDTIEKVVFYKRSDADWTLEENQDRITDKVWITRAESKGIFNIAQEPGYDRNSNTSPAGTEWAYGYTLELTPDKYDTWYNLHNQNTPEIVGQPISLHLIEDDLYFDVMFTGWQRGEDGGGAFSYIRSEPFLPLEWGQAYPLRGVLDPGESQVVEVTFDAADQVAGIKNGKMILYSNDDDNPETVITMSLEVLGNPEIEVAESQLEFGDVYLGYPVSMELTIINNGNDVLSISDIEFDIPEFSAADTALEVPPYDELNLMVYLLPSTIKEYSGIMTIHSDDPLNPAVEVSLTGTGVIAPQITLNLTELSEVMFSGEVATQTFTITNTGLSSLDWYLGPEQIEFTFTKKSGDDFRLAEFQDRVSDNVWITRGTREGLFNIAQEASYDRDNDDSPLGTEWAPGFTADVDPANYTTWRDAVRNVANIRTWELPGRTFSMKLTEENSYWDITFLEWQRSGGSVSYVRRFASGTLNRNWVTFSNEEGTLGPGESTDITVTFNPNINIPSGEFMLEMNIYSNDPTGPVFMPVTLRIDDIVAVDPIPDTLVQEGFGEYSKDISAVFATNSENEIMFEAISSNEMVATVEVVNDTLIVTEQGTGIAEITLLASTEFGESGNQTFVLRVNDFPAASAMDNRWYPDGFMADTIDLSPLFTDTDDDELTISVETGYDTVITAIVSEGLLMLTEMGSGIDTVILFVEDGIGGTDTTSFEVTINTPPVLVNPISDVEIEEFFTTQTIDISGVFTDVDMDPLSYEAESSNEDVVLSFLDGTDLVIVEVGRGVSTITVVVTDDITMHPDTATFDFTVNQSTVGLESMSEDEFRLYPNPSDGNVVLALTDTYQGELQITVFDMRGTKVYIGNHTVYKSQINLDLTSLEQGLYILQFSSDDVNQKARLIIE